MIVVQKWQIGISQATSDKIDWQDDFVFAKDQWDAQTLAVAKGYYRNLRIRKID